MRLYLILFFAFLNTDIYSQICNQDLNGNGVIDGGDLLELLSVYGQICSSELMNVPVISEIHYNPSSTQGNDSEWEFIELFNPNSVSIDLSGWKIVDGVEAEIEQNTFLEPYRFILFAKSPSSYNGELPFSTIVFNLQGDLDNSGEIIRLLNSDGLEVDRVEYVDIFPWQIEPDGLGSSLEWLGDGFDNQLPSSWSPSIYFGGTPGSSNSSWAD